MSIEDLFPELKTYKAEDFQELGFNKPALMIAITARTGSTHLCSALSSVLNVPSPVEIFNSRGIIQRQIKLRNVSSFSEYMKSLSQDTGDYFVFKTSWNDFKLFKNHYMRLFPDLMVLYINRLDIEQQAVSLYKAGVSGVWHKNGSGKSSATSDNDDLSNKFDLKSVCKSIASLEREKRDWESFFYRERISPLRLNYEDFEDDVEGAVDFVLQHFNFIKTSSVLLSDYEKLSDDVSEQWVKELKRYRYARYDDADIGVISGARNIGKYLSKFIKL